MRFIRNNWRWIGLFLGVYLLLLGMFYITSVGAEAYRIMLNMRRYGICSLSVVLAIWAWKRHNLPVRALCPYAIVGISWIFSFNVCDYLTYRDNSNNINNYMDIAFGAYLFAAMVFFRLLVLSKLNKDYFVVKVFFTLLQVCAISIPIVQLLYFGYYGASISTYAGIALLQTNWAETQEFLVQNLGYLGITEGIIFLIIIVILFYLLNSWVSTEQYIRGGNMKPGKMVLIMGILFVAICAYFPKSFMGTGVVKALSNAYSYMKEAQAFKYYHDKNFAALHVEPSTPKFSKPSTIILIIGESAGRNFMSAYGYSANDTTPWLRESITNDSVHFLRFNHAYSSWGSTVQSLEQALTQKNQYNHKDFNQSLTIIDLAKKAGYKTYWFSNQGTRRSPDTPITLVAKTSDYSHWIEDDHPDRIAYDGDLLSCLKIVDPNENNFVVIHVMGSHELTLHRFPPEFTRFSQKGVFDLVPNYEDSMAYTDWVLKQIFEYSHKHLNLQAMIFFSDHGANPYRKRTADHIPFINLRIPFILYLSDEYQSLYPQTTETLRNHLDAYITNDLLYEAVGGILNLTSAQIDNTANIASPFYAYTRDTLKTNLGQNFLSEDKYEDKITAVE